MGDEVFPVVGDDVKRGSMLREDVYQEKYRNILGINIPMGRDEQCHFGETTDNDQDGIIALRQWEAFYEVHGKRIPWSYGNRKELKWAERLGVD